MYEEQKHQIVESAQLLARKGYLMATGGNLSLRIPGQAAFAVTPSNYDYFKMTAEDVCFGLWSLTFGGYSLVASSPSLAAIGIREPLVAIRDNANRLLDGLGWQPLSGAIEFPALAARIAAEVFPAETQQLAAR